MSKENITFLIMLFAFNRGMLNISDCHYAICQCFIIAYYDFLYHANCLLQRIKFVRDFADIKLLHLISQDRDKNIYIVKMLGLNVGPFTCKEKSLPLPYFLFHVGNVQICNLVQHRVKMYKTLIVKMLKSFDLMP